MTSQSREKKIDYILNGHAGKPSSNGSRSSTSRAKGREKKRPSISDLIVQLASGRVREWFHTPDQTAFATIRVANHFEVYPVESTAFRRWLRHVFFQATSSAPNANALGDAVNVLASLALYDGPSVPVEVRVGQQGHSIFLDLADADWRAVEISSTGWEIVAQPSVRFRRPSGMYPILEPQRGGSVDLLRPFVNCKSDSGFQLVVAWLLAALRPGRPFPVLFLRGEQGSAKSTLARLLRNLVDPNKALLRRPPREERDLIIAASNGWTVTFDNLSFVPDWLSDGLCCLATGSGFSTRTLYTNADESIFQATRPVLLTAIEDVVTRGDLLDRCLTVDLEPIPDHRRRTEAEIEAEFQKVAPLILGALLDAAAAALKNLPTTRLATLPRMADFATWVVAAERALRWQPGRFLATYSETRASGHETALSDSLIYPPLVDLLQAGKWTGTASELLEALALKVGEKVTRHRSWPSKPKALSDRLKRLAPALRSVGITIERFRDRTGKRWVGIELCNPLSSSSSASSARDSSEFSDDASDDEEMTQPDDSSSRNSPRNDCDDDDDASLQPLYEDIDSLRRTENVNIPDFD
jgi:hypothetical protein